MSGIFISYAEEDGVLAARVQRDLDRARLHAWTYERDGELGVDFEAEVRQRIARCACFLLLDSRPARASTYVADECRQFRERVAAGPSSAQLIVCLAQPDGAWRTATELFDRQNAVRYADLSSYSSGIRDLSLQLGVAFVPEFAMPRDEDFIAEVRALQLPAAERDRLLDTYAEFRRCSDRSQLRDAEAELRTLRRRLDTLGTPLPTPLLALGVLYGELRRDADAESAFAEATRVAPRDPRGWAGVGGARALRSCFADALAAYERAVDLLRETGIADDAEERPLVYVNAAFTAAALGRLDRALELLGEVGANTLSSPAANALRGQILMLQGRTAAARTSFEAALAGWSRAVALGSGLLLDLADTCALLEDDEQEEEILARAMLRYTGESAVHRRAAVFYARRGELADAIDALRAAIAIDGGVLQYHAELALTLATAGLRDECEAEIAWCIARNVSSSEEYYYAGLAYYLNGQPHVAAEYRRRADQDPLVSRWARYSSLAETSVIAAWNR